MSNLESIETERFLSAAQRVGIAAVVLIVLAAAVFPPATVRADPLDEPGLTEPECHGDGISMFWHTKNRGEAAAPDGWKVERRHQVSGTWVVQTFMFVGAEADALQTVRDGYWDWVDTSAEQSVDYIYRVRAINADGSDMDGRIWSRNAEVFCSSEFPGILNQPGLSILACESNGVALFWHTRNRGEAGAPAGWRLERRHWAAGGWVVKTYAFIGGDADVLQTHSDEYWDWVDTTADPDVDYTYRVRAINTDGSDMADRFWSRRAPVQC